MSKFESVPTPPEYAESIRAWCTENKIPLSNLSIRCGLKPQTLTTLCSAIRCGRRKSVNMRTVAALHRVTGISAEGGPYA